MLQGFEVIPINCLWIRPNELITTLKRMDDEDEDRGWLYERQSLDLKKIYFPVPPKGGAHLPRFAVWQPSNLSFGSVLVPNYGDELIQLMRHLNKRFQIRYFSAHLSRDHRKEGICRFEHADETGTVRVVHVILDSGWEFYEEGAVLPFENPIFYQQEKIAERLTPSVVLQYLKVLGWDLKSEEFWESKGDAWVGRKIAFK